jgi:hypothetical protein
MAGLIEQQVGAPAPEQQPAGAMPVEDPAMMQQSAEMEPGETEDLDENNPGFQTALKIAMQALYEAGAAEDAAQALLSAPDPIEGLANTAYEMVEVAASRVEVFDEEYLPLLAIVLLSELTDIAEAAGKPYQPAQVAEAFKQMTLRFLQEQGADISELQAAMDQVDPAVFDQAAAQQEEMPV